MKPLILVASAGCTPVPLQHFDQFKAMLLPGSLEAGEERLDCVQTFPWGTITRISGLAVEHHTIPPKLHGERGNRTIITLHGRRVLSNLRGAAGYCHEGTASIAGKKRRAFTSDHMFELPDGTLFNVGILYVC